MKDTIGRAHPVLFDTHGAYNSEPFALNSRQTSFPSRHSSTIGAIATIGAIIVPKYRWAFAAFAGIVGLARTVDGAHYPSDVVFGVALGAVISCLTFRFAADRRILPEAGSLECAAAGRGELQLCRSVLPVPTEPLESDILRLKPAMAVLLASTIALVLFISRPDLDYSISRLFCDDADGFWLKTHPVLGVFRQVYMLMFALTVNGACLLWYAALRRRDKMSRHPAIWGFSLAAIVVGPGLIAQKFFGAYWGRARPAHVEEFGGQANHTYPFQMSNECEHNCSFLPGESSGIAVLLLIVVALAWPVFRKTVFVLSASVGLIALFGNAFRKDLGNLKAYLVGPLPESCSLLRDLWRVVLSFGYVFATAGKIFAAFGSGLAGAFPLARQRSGA